MGFFLFMVQLGGGGTLAPTSGEVVLVGVQRRIAIAEPQRRIAIAGENG